MLNTHRHGVEINFPMSGAVQSPGSSAHALAARTKASNHTHTHGIPWPLYFGRKTQLISSFSMKEKGCRIAVASGIGGRGEGDPIPSASHVLSGIH